MSRRRKLALSVVRAGFFQLRSCLVKGRRLKGDHLRPGLAVPDFHPQLRIILVAPLPEAADFLLAAIKHPFESRPMLTRCIIALHSVKA